MVSGKYSVLSGAVSREQALANISNNMANINSTGFKKNRISFEALLRGSKQTTTAKGINYNRIGTIRVDHEQGPLHETGRSLDVAISGTGFFKVRRGNEILYSRNGNFFADSNGMIKTAQGFNVLNSSNQPIQLVGAEGKKIHIDESGNIALDTLSTGEKIQVFTVTDPDKLTKVGDTLFKLEQGAGSQANNEARVMQRNLEGSNVNMVEEMTLMIDTQRKFEAYSKVLKNYSRLGEKQNELGSVG